LISSATAQLSCPYNTPPTGSAGTYGATCTDNAVSWTAANGCQPSSSCGYLYCCLSCSNSTGSNFNVCMLPPQIAQVTINCQPNSGPNSWYGCPCTSSSQCPNSGNGWQCSTSAPLFNAGTTGVNGVQVGSPQTGVAQVTYPQSVCWTNSLAYTSAASPTNYYNQFTNAVYPVAPICNSASDCKNTTNAPPAISPYGPFFCDSTGTTSCQSKASCDPVTHACQSRQAANEQLGSSPSTSFVNKAWWYNQWWSQTNCYNC